MGITFLLSKHSAWVLIHTPSLASALTPRWSPHLLAQWRHQHHVISSCSALCWWPRKERPSSVGSFLWVGRVRAHRKMSSFSESQRRDWSWLADWRKRSSYSMHATGAYWVNSMHIVVWYFASSNATLGSWARRAQRKRFQASSQVPWSTILRRDALPFLWPSCNSGLSGSCWNDCCCCYRSAWFCWPTLCCGHRR